MKKTKNDQQNKNIKVAVLVIFILLLAGIVGYLLATSNSNVQDSDTNQTSESNNANTDDVGTMMSKVRMEMPKSDVNKEIGEPYECTRSNPATAEDAQHNMEQCSYGDRNAANHLGVTYMDGKVWGTTSVSNATR